MKFESEMTEKEIKKKTIKAAKEMGWFHISLTGVSVAGIPDSLFIKDGRFKFVEFKTTSGTLSKIQKRMIDRMDKFGIEVMVSHSPSQILYWLET